MSLIWVRTCVAIPQISGTTHNVFGIQTGVAIGIFVRDKSKLGQCVSYAAGDAEPQDKLCLSA